MPPWNDRFRSEMAEVCRLTSSYDDIGGQGFHLGERRISHFLSH